MSKNNFAQNFIYKPSKAIKRLQKKICDKEQRKLCDGQCEECDYLPPFKIDTKLLRHNQQKGIGVN